MTGILSELVSGGLGFHHETQLPERILQSEDASCVIKVIYILRFIFVLFIYLLTSKFFIQHGNYIPMTFICNLSMFCADMFLMLL